MHIYQPKPRLGVQLNRKHPLAKGLVGCWVMNEKTGDIVFDLSGHGNNGTLINNADWVNTTYGIGTEYPTDGGTDRIDLGSVGSAKSLSGVPTGELSVVAKLYKPADGTGTNLYPRIIDKSNGGNSANGWALFYNESTDGFLFQITGTSIVEESLNYTAAGWYNVAATIKPNDNKLYINNDVYSSASAVTFSTATTNAAIGNWNHDDDRQWTGYIVYVYVYNRALSPYEVSWLNREPYAMFQQPINPALFYYEAPTGFNPAWARSINNLLQDGITNV